MGRPRGLILKLIATSLAVLLCALTVGFAWLYQSVSTVANTERGNPQPSDCIVVLGAAVWPNEQPTPALRARAELGIELYQKGYARHLIFTGGVGTNPPAEAEVMRRLAAEAGVPAEVIVVEDKATTTQESALFVKEIARSHSWNSVIVVSDPFHLPRATWMFADQGFAVTAAGTNDFYYDSRTRDYQTFRECLGLIVYALQRPFLALSGQTP